MTLSKPSTDVVILAYKEYLNEGALSLTTSSPECLLPLRNAPLLWYQLENVRVQLGQPEQTSGAGASTKSNVTILCRPSHKKAIDESLDAYRQVVASIPDSSNAQVNMTAGAVTEKGEGDDDEESVSSFHSMKRLIMDMGAASVLILSSDILASLPLKAMTGLMENEKASCVVLLGEGDSGGSVTQAKSSGKVKAGDTKNSEERWRQIARNDYSTVALARDSRLHGIKASNDLAYGGSLKVSKNVLVSAGNLTFSSQAVDLHTYLVDVQTLKALISSPHYKTLGSLRHDVIPLLAAFQGDELSSKLSAGAASPLKSGSVRSIMLSETSPFGMPCRMNTFDKYRDIGLKFLAPRILNIIEELPVLKDFIEALETAFPTRAEKNMLVGECSTIDVKAVVKKCYIGRNCNIASGVKLNSCIILDNCKIASNCTLQMSIIGESVTIESGCNLSQCEVEAGLNVEAKSVHQKEKLTKTNDEICL